jgi:hypothetical protein
MVVPVRIRRLCGALIALTLLAACSGGGDDDDGAGLGNTSSTAPPEAPAPPSPSPAGTGVVVIGSLSSSFRVTECELQLSPEGGNGELLRMTGAGTRANGVGFTVEAVRSVSDRAAEAFTDLITYVDTARILQVQRSEVGGEVTDLRDPAARGTLLRVRPDGLSAAGIAGPPGTSAPEGPGLVGLALDATCEP